MDDAQIEFFRNLLNERLRALIENAGETLGQLTGERENLPDPVDIATNESNREFTLRLQERDRHLVNKIRSALKRLDEGEYGVCIACGDDINPKRLMARPVATHCIDCKTAAEHVQYGVR